MAHKMREAVPWDDVTVTSQRERVVAIVETGVTNATSD